MRPQAEKTNLIYGTRAVMEAVEAGKEIESIFIQQGISNPLMNELRTLLKKNQITYKPVPPEKINRMVRGNHQGVVAFISMITYHNIEDILPALFEKSKVPLLLICDHITDVRNFGALARSALCAGVHAIIIPEKGSAQINADAVKTSAGALHKIPVCRQHLLNAVKFLKQSGVRIFASTEKASEHIYEADFKEPVAIIMGSEENGITRDLLKAADYLVKIPMQQELDSLNVSVAASVVLFEVVRQRLTL